MRSIGLVFLCVVLATVVGFSSAISEELDELCIPMQTLTLEPLSGAEQHRASVDFPHGLHWSESDNRLPPEPRTAELVSPQDHPDKPRAAPALGDEARETVGEPGEPIRDTMSSEPPELVIIRVGVIASRRLNHRNRCGTTTAALQSEAHYVTTRTGPPRNVSSQTAEGPRGCGTLLTPAAVSNCFSTCGTTLRKQQPDNLSTEIFP